MELLVWIFCMRIMMIVASGVSYFINDTIAQRQVRQRAKNGLREAADHARMAHLHRLGRPHLYRFLSADPELDGDTTLWWKLSVITCGTLAGAIIPEFVKIFTSVNSAHVKEIVTSAREGGASLGILSGLVAGNFSAYWLGTAIFVDEYRVWRRTLGLAALMMAPAVFAFGLVAFGFLGMGPVTIAVTRTARLPTTPNRSTSYRPSRPSLESRTRSRSSSASTRTSTSRRTFWKKTTAPATPSRQPPSPC